MRWRNTHWGVRYSAWVLGIILALYTVANLRGWWALKRYREYWAAQGEWFDWSDRPVFPELKKEEYLFGSGKVEEIINSRTFKIRDIAALDFSMKHLKSSERRFGRQAGKLVPFPDLIGSGAGASRTEGAVQFLKAIDHLEADIEAVTAATLRASAIQFTLPELSEFDDDEDQPGKLNSLGDFSRLQSLRASARLESGDGEGAIEDIRTCAKLGDLLLETPAFLYFLEGGATLEQCAEAVWEGLYLQKWDSSGLAELAKIFDAARDDRIPKDVFLIERGLVWALIGEYDQFAERLNVSNHYNLEASFGSPYFVLEIPRYIPFHDSVGEKLGHFLFRIVPDGWFSLWKIEVSEKIRVGCFGQSPYQIGVMAQAPYNPWDTYGTYRAFSIAKQEAIAVMRCGALAIACERYLLKYKAYPGTMSDLIPEFLASEPMDPFSEKPLIYRPPTDEEERPLIYSIGRNRTDELGLVEEQTWKGDIVWKY